MLEGLSCRELFKRLIGDLLHVRVPWQNSLPPDMLHNAGVQLPVLQALDGTQATGTKLQRGNVAKDRTESVG